MGGGHLNEEKSFYLHSQYERAIHRFYSEPARLCTNPFLHGVYLRLYWAFRSLQFCIFYKNEELDIEEAYDPKNEGVVHPPSLAELGHSTPFNTKWLKYFYGRFKNECPSGRMKEADFRRIVCAVIESNQAIDPYISRLFAAFSSDPTRDFITFQDIVESLSFLADSSPEVHAEWTIKLITGKAADQFLFPEFYAFVTSVFSLGDARDRMKRNLEKETPKQRAVTLFKELDADQDGVVTKEDLVNSLRTIERWKPDSCPV